MPRSPVCCLVGDGGVLLEMTQCDLGGRLVGRSKGGKTADARITSQAEG